MIPAGITAPLISSSPRTSHLPRAPFFLAGAIYSGQRQVHRLLGRPKSLLNYDLFFTADLFYVLYSIL
jgi:hypothetical protein